MGNPCRSWSQTGEQIRNDHRVAALTDSQSPREPLKPKCGLGADCGPRWSSANVQITDPDGALK